MSHVAHFAINADDVERARTFYSQVFGWKFNAWGPPGFYLIATGGPEDKVVQGSLQGRRALIPGQKTIGFECTVSVPSIDDTIRALKSHNAKFLMDKSTIAGVGTLVFFEDTEGNAVGVIEFDKDYKHGNS
jgi:predicted enzyme related to lactoylglutathione lyase